MSWAVRSKLKPGLKIAHSQLVQLVSKIESVPKTVPRYYVIDQLSLLLLLLEKDDDVIFLLLLLLLVENLAQKSEWSHGRKRPCVHYTRAVAQSSLVETGRASPGSARSSAV